MVSITVALSFGDFTDPTGSVVHVTRTVGWDHDRRPDTIVGSGSWPWVYDDAPVEGSATTSELRRRRGPCAGRGQRDVTVERRVVSLGLNVWADPHGAGHVYAHLSGCHSNRVVVLSVSSGSTPPRVIARVEVSVGGGYTPTVDFKRKGATAVDAAYAGDEWFLPANAVWTYPSEPLGQDPPRLGWSSAMTSSSSTETSRPRTCGISSCFHAATVSALSLTSFSVVYMATPSTLPVLGSPSQ
jgi:hypothetical protein